MDCQWLTGASHIWLTYKWNSFERRGIPHHSQLYSKKKKKSIIHHITKHDPADRETRRHEQQPVQTTDWRHSLLALTDWNDQERGQIPGQTYSMVDSTYIKVKGASELTVFGDTYLNWKVCIKKKESEYNKSPGCGWFGGEKGLGQRRARQGAVQFLPRMMVTLYSMQSDWLNWRCVVSAFFSFYYISGILGWGVKSNTSYPSRLHPSNSEVT